MKPLVHSSRRRWSIALLAVAVAIPLLGPAQAAGPLDPVLGDPGYTYPDLKPNVGNDLFVEKTPIGINPSTGETIYAPARLFFDTHSQNLGAVSVQLTADDPANPATTTVSQCVSWYSQHVCREQRQVGGFEWHDEHTHFHYKDFASYAFRRFNSDGTVDFSSDGVVSKSDKVSFCLMDTTTAQDAEEPSPTPFYPACTSAQQGISPGWTDIYTSDLEGQQLSLEGLTDGRYALVITQDYANTLFETNDTNNRIVVTVELSDMDTAAPQAEVVGRAWPPTNPGGGDPDPDPEPEPEGPPRHDDTTSGLPDLVPVVTNMGASQTFVLDPETNQFVPGPPEMWFDMQPQNLGGFPLQLTADDPSNLETSTVSQCVAWLAEHVCATKQPVEGFEWNGGDTSFHFRDLATYSLRRLKRNGNVDFSSRGLVSSVNKDTNCILDAQQVDADAAPAPFYATCSPLLQGVSPGWTDLYTSDLEGQQLSLEGLDDGVYALVIDLDPRNRLAEFDDLRNRLVVTVELTNLNTTAPQARIVQQSWKALAKQRRG